MSSGYLIVVVTPSYSGHEFQNGNKNRGTTRVHRLQTGKTQQEEESELARVSEITGALNSRAFREVVRHESKRSRRSRLPLTVAYIDLDGFKKVNDLLLHSTGDKVLKVVAETMKSTLREMDSVSRLHGDEYALLLPETSAENARVVLDKLRVALKGAMKTNRWKITFSIGVVTFRNPPDTPDYLINEADKMMLSVKKTGKNRVSYLALD